MTKQKITLETKMPGQIAHPGQEQVLLVCLRATSRFTGAPEVPENATELEVTLLTDPGTRSLPGDFSSVTFSKVAFFGVPEVVA